MNLLRCAWRGWNRGAPAGIAVTGLLALSSTTAARAHATGSGFRDVQLAEYRQHLQELDGVVAGCAAQLQLKSPPPRHEDACDPERVGLDDRVQGMGGFGRQAREVRYDWLRTALRTAGDKESGAAAIEIGARSSAKIKALDTKALLQDAQDRLRMDELEAEGPPAADPVYSVQRKSLDAILARPEYRSATRVSPRDRLVEWLDNLLNEIFMRLGAMGARLPWIGRLLEGLLLAGALAVAAWLLVRLERNGRVRLVPDIEAARGAPSAREWQSWLKDAETAAAAGAWREAIHSVYWASISRLESGRMWPADRARTPREYLGLLGGSDPRKPTLTALTRSFERTWYGGREAAAGEFDAALHLAAELGVKAE